MKKILSMALLGTMLFPSLSYAQGYTPEQKAELIASLTSQIQALIKLYYEALQRELDARIAAQNQAISQQNASIAQVQAQVQAVRQNQASQPVVQPSVSSGTGGTGMAVSQPAAVPASCSLDGILLPSGAVSVTWTSQGLTSGQTGILSDDYKGIVDGGKVQYQIVDDAISQSGTQRSLQPSFVYKAVFGNVSCFAFFGHQEDATSTPTAPASFYQLKF